MTPRGNRGLLIVEPTSIVRFVGPFTEPAVTKMTLINPTEYRIIYKIKTTAPAFYGVRPNIGVIKPHSFADIEIARRAIDYSKSLNHKFMVQSLEVPNNVEDLDMYWKNLDPLQLKSLKLRCIFEMPPNKSLQSLSRAQQLPDLSANSLYYKTRDF